MAHSWCTLGVCSVQSLQQLPAVEWDLSIPKGSCKALQVTKRYQVSGEEWAGEVAASGG